MTRAMEKITFKENTRIATWNVKGMMELGKAHNITHEMERLKVKILGISEARWKGTGKTVIQDTTIYYSGCPESEKSNYYGVAIAVDRNTSKSVKHFLPLPGRVALLQLNAQGRQLNIIQVYAPTGDKVIEEVEEFYKDVETAMKQTKSKDITIVLGDFNAKVGKSLQNECVGSFGLGERNDRGDRLLQFCQEHKTVLTNTFFKLPKRRLYTWRSPADKPGRLIRNQIDFILMNQRYKNAVKSAKTYPGADVGSDHSILIAEIRMKLKKLIQNKRRPLLDVRKLNDIRTKGNVCQEIKNFLSLSM